MIYSTLKDFNERRIYEQFLYTHYILIFQSVNAIALRYAPKEASFHILLCEHQQITLQDK